MKIQVCTWRSCKWNFSEYIMKRLENDKKMNNNCNNVIIEQCLCTWNCKDWPVVLFDWKLETRVSPSLASKIVNDKKK